MVNDKVTLHIGYCADGGLVEVDGSEGKRFECAAVDNASFNGAGLGDCGSAEECECDYMEGCSHGLVKANEVKTKK